MHLTIYFIGINLDKLSKELNDKFDVNSCENNIKIFKDKYIENKWIKNVYSIIFTLKPIKRYNARKIDYFFKNLKNVEEKNGIYFFNINNDLFTNLDEYANFFIDDILKNYSNKQLNKKMWWDDCRYKDVYDYCKKKDIKTTFPRMKITNIVNFNFKPENCYLELENSTDNDCYFLKILDHKRENKTPKYIVGFDKSEVDVFRIEDLIISLFDTLFSHKEFNIHIKKCRKCKKYFLFKNGNNKYCSRLYKDGLTCTEYSKKYGDSEDDTNFDIVCSKLYSNKRNRILNRKNKKNNEIEQLISEYEYQQFKKIIISKSEKENCNPYEKLFDIIITNNETKINKIKEFNLKEFFSTTYINNLK